MAVPCVAMDFLPGRRAGGVFREVLRKVRLEHGGHGAAKLDRLQLAEARYPKASPPGAFPALNMGELAVVYSFVLLYFAAAGAGP